MDIEVQGSIISTLGIGPFVKPRHDLSESNGTIPILYGGVEPRVLNQDESHIETVRKSRNLGIPMNGYGDLMKKRIANGSECFLA